MATMVSLSFWALLFAQVLPSSASPLPFADELLFRFGTLAPPGLLPEAFKGVALVGGPFIAPSWEADMMVPKTFPIPGVLSLKGHMYYDQPNQRSRQILDAHFALFSADDSVVTDTLTVNATGLNVNMTVGVGSDAICKATAYPYAYADPFSLLQRFGQHTGSATVQGEPCEIWSLRAPGITLGLSVCMAKDGAPRAMNVSGRGNFEYSNVRVGPIDGSVFAASEACATRYPTPACELGSRGGGGEQPQVVELSLFRIHGSEEPITLRDRNLGDSLGDMAFVCQAGSMQIYTNKWVTQWTVKANASWGQYGYCIFNGTANTCFGGTGKQVGRESAEGLGGWPVQGQCSANTNTGSWFSFPSTGACSADEAIGTAGCTWGQAVRGRTVAASCVLEERGLAQACAEERGHAPFGRSAAIFVAALRTADPTQGGCPDVQQEEEEEKEEEEEVEERAIVV